MGIEDFDPKPGPSNTAAEFDLEVFDSGSSCSLEDYWLNEVVNSSKTSKDRFGNFKSSNKNKRRTSKDNNSGSTEGSSPLQEFRLRSGSFDLDCMEEEGDVQLAQEAPAAGSNNDNADNSNLGSPMAGPSGLNQNQNHGNIDEPPASACPSDDDDDEVQLPKDCADKSEVVDSWKCTPSTSKASAPSASAEPDAAEVQNAGVNDSNSQENIDAIVQDHDNFGTDENEDSMDAVSLEDVAASIADEAATTTASPSPKIQFKLPEDNASNDFILDTAAEMEIFDAGERSTACASDTDGQTKPAAAATLTDAEVTSNSDANGSLGAPAAAAAGKKRKSDTLEDEANIPDDDDSSFEEEFKKQKLSDEDNGEDDDEAGEEASSTPSSNSQKPNAEVMAWLESFSKFSRADKQTAVDLLISSCQPDQVRHMLAVIEPQFQRDFISHLPKEVGIRIFQTFR